MKAEELLRSGQLNGALAALESEVRADPANAKLRVFLFQLLCVLGDWERALSQLNTAAELDATNLLMAQVCRSALNCEALRGRIFAGEHLPLIFGKPEDWVGLLVQANQLVSEGKYEASRELRERAFEDAPPLAGTIDNEQFGWIADADTRFGPLLEAIVDGKYYWIPFTAIKRIRIEPPADLRDIVWIPAIFTWVNEGEVPGLIPARYPGSESSDDEAVRLARKTEWVEKPGDVYVGLGQRMFATDAGEFSILEVRQIELGHDEVEQQGGTDNG
ncbi:MAG: tetratricopeptide repeat protein [Phycisphaerales bacterium]|nr:MAG: tetratricopeptide repeat protein [Phycisphaerales bacterium]